MQYNYSFPDFMQYAIDSGLDLTEEGEILWAQTKPLPAELVKDLFFDAPHHISTFLNHTFTAVIAALGQLKYNSINVNQSTPSDKLSPEQFKELKSYFDEFSALIKAVLSSNLKSLLNQNIFDFIFIRIS